VPRLPPSLEVLRRPDFRRLFLGQAASLLGDGMVNVALAFAVLGLGGSASEVGFVFAARMLTLVASLLAGGVVADRTSPRAVMVVADLVRVASQGTMAALLIAGAPEVWSLAALAAVTGAATGFFLPASTALMPAVVPPEELQSANGLRITALAAGEVGGPAIAAALVVAAGAGWAIAIDAATFAVSAALLARLRPGARGTAVAGGFLGDLRHGWREFRTRRWVWGFVLWATVGNVVNGAWIVLGPVVADRHLGGPAAWGTAAAAAGAGGLLGGVVAVRVRPARPLLVAALGFAIWGLPLAFLAARAPVAVLACAAVASGCGVTLAQAVWDSTLQRRIPATSLSRVSAYDWFGSMAFAPLGLAIWGPISVAIGLSGALWLAFGAQLAAAAGLLALPEVRGVLPRAGDEPGEIPVAGGDARRDAPSEHPMTQERP
jgi:hypothetical protein